MKKVHFLIDRTRIVDYLISPLRVNRNRLYEKGYDIKFFFKPKGRFFNCNTIIFLSKPLFALMKNDLNPVITPPSSIIDLLVLAKEKADKVIWLDTSDSTSVTHFELLPYVDLYLKKHIFKDKSLYKKQFYGGRIFSDYYHNEYGLVDSKPFNQFFPLEEKYYDKVDLAWNMGIGDTYNAFTKRTKLRLLFPNIFQATYNFPTVPANSHRNKDIFLRASANWPRETVVFHRKELIRQLQNMLLDDPELSGSVSGEIPVEEYRKQMSESKIAFGPFGWGELNIREYEALIMGCLLLRPDISHMATWPEIFFNGETCVFYSWNFDDLKDKVYYYLENKKERLRIAQNGQDAYLNTLSDKGMLNFCDWFISQIKK